MARQVRSEATRRKILDAAVDVFTEVGFASADRGAIIERTGMTKGAFYHHFDSMEALASAIIEDGANLVVSELGAMSDSFSPPWRTSCTAPSSPRICSPPTRWCGPPSS